MKLGFDIDGIVADMAQSLVDHINDKFGLNHTVDVFEYHKLSKNKYVDDPALDKEIVDSMYDNVIRGPEGILSVEPYEGVRQELLKLKRAGHTLHYITARWEAIHQATVDWFRKNKLPFDSIDTVGTSSKGMLGRPLNLDFYMDDQVEHLESMYKYKSRWSKGLVLYTRPWNINESLDAGRFVRINNWKGVFRHLGIHNR